MLNWVECLGKVETEENTIQFLDRQPLVCNVGFGIAGWYNGGLQSDTCLAKYYTTSSSKLQLAGKYKSFTHSNVSLPNITLRPASQSQMQW